MSVRRRAIAERLEREKARGEALKDFKLKAPRIADVVFASNSRMGRHLRWRAKRRAAA